jgi:hypothetical protein
MQDKTLSFPDDVLNEIFKYFKGKDFSSLVQVCKQWALIISTRYSLDSPIGKMIRYTNSFFIPNVEKSIQDLERLNQQLTLTFLSHAKQNFVISIFLFLIIATFLIGTVGGYVFDILLGKVEETLEATAPLLESFATQLVKLLQRLGLSNEIAPHRITEANLDTNNLFFQNAIAVFSGIIFIRNNYHYFPFVPAILLLVYWLSCQYKNYQIQQTPNHPQVDLIARNFFSGESGKLVLACLYDPKSHFFLDNPWTVSQLRQTLRSDQNKLDDLKKTLGKEIKTTVFKKDRNALFSNNPHFKSTFVSQLTVWNETNPPDKLTEDDVKILGL